MDQTAHPGRAGRNVELPDACAMGEYLPLARAAILAHERLFPGHAVKETKSLDVLALALSALLPLYQRDGKTDELERVSEAQLAAGRFTRGATRLEFRDRPPIGGLVVAREDLGGALDTLVRDSLVAARLEAICSRTWAPRRP
jgi:hypothetical protein